MLAFQFIAFYNKRITYNLLIPIMLLKFGNFEPSPTKSLILLHRVATSITVSSSALNFLNLKNSQLYLWDYATQAEPLNNLEGSTHKSVKSLKTEMLEGMGPSKPLARISLLATQFKWIFIKPETIT